MPAFGKRCLKTALDVRATTRDYFVPESFRDRLSTIDVPSRPSRDSLLGTIRGHIALSY